MMTLPLLAYLMADIEKGDAGWAAAVVLLIGAVGNLLYKFWAKYGEDKAVLHKTTVVELQGLLRRTEKTMSDMVKSNRDREEEFEESLRRTRNEKAEALQDHNECLRRYEQLAVWAQWVTAILREKGHEPPPFPQSGDTGKHTPLSLDTPPGQTKRKRPATSPPSDSPDPTGADL